MIRFSARGVIYFWYLIPYCTVNDIHQCSNKLKFYFFADDTNILYAVKNLNSLENIVNIELRNLHERLTSNKLTLNIAQKLTL